MQREISELKTVVNHLANGTMPETHSVPLKEYPLEDNELDYQITRAAVPDKSIPEPHYEESIIIEDNDLSLGTLNKAAIIKALERHNNNRKLAAEELKISERTLYRKIKEYKLNDK